MRRSLALVIVVSLMLSAAMPIVGSAAPPLPAEPNSAISAQMEGPDLAPISANPSAVTAIPGETVYLSWTVKNQGAVEVPANEFWCDEIFLSEDTVPNNGGDYNLKQSCRGGPVAAGSTYDFLEQDAWIPSVKAPGSYFLLISVDYQGSIAETDTTNNVWPIPLTITGPDLVPTALNPSATSAHIGETITLSWTVKNQGTGPVPAGVYSYSSDEVYLSLDTVWDSSDQFLVENFTGFSAPLPVGDSYSTPAEGVAVWIGPDVPVGDYTLLLVVDRGDALREGNEANNVLIGPAFSILPSGWDLVPTIVPPIPEAANPGTEVSVSGTVMNQGASDIPAGYGLRDCLYLSTDEMLDTQYDVLLDEQYLSTYEPLAAGATYELWLSGTLPGDQLPGSYFLLVMIDDYGVLPESSETNNLLAFPLTIVGNTPPVALAGGPYTADEGVEVTLDGSGSYDPDVGDAITSYEWDLDYDEVSVDIGATGVAPIVTYGDNGLFTLALQVVDSRGGVSEVATTTATVQNAAPTVDAGPDATIDQGQIFSGSGAFSDPGALDTHTATVDYGESGGPENLTLYSDYTFDLSHTYAQVGSYTVTVTVTDDDAGVNSDSLIVTVSEINATPVVNAGSDATVSEGGSYSGSATYSDLNAADTHTAVVDYGDGSPLVDLGAVSGGTVAIPAHVYADGPATSTLTVTVTDSQGADGSDSLVVTVENAAPVMEPMAPIAQVNVKDSVSVNARFSDPGSDTHTALIAWGDGSTTKVRAANLTGWVVTGTHAYRQAGIYTVTVTVTDSDGASGEVVTTVTVIDPTEPPPVVNTPPVMGPMTPIAPVNVRDKVTVSAGFIDPDAGDSHTGVIDWGDGKTTRVKVTAQTGMVVSGTHAYRQAGTYSVTITVTDQAGASATVTTTVTVLDPAPQTAEQDLQVAAPEETPGAPPAEEAAPPEEPEQEETRDGSPRVREESEEEDES
jgi:PKD repeat protein